MTTEAESETVPAGSPARLNASRLLLLGVLVLPIGVSQAPDPSVASALFRLQDWPIVVALVAALFAMTYRVPPLRLPDWAPGWWVVAAGAVVLTLALWWGTYAIMENYPVTRDEDMVLFDMVTLAKGRLAEPLAPEWRPYLTTLVPVFLLEVPGNAAFVSSYLPGNAAMRLAFSTIADPALMNPVLIGLSVLALFDIARRLFPDDNRAITVTLLLYVMSSQVLVTAMTDYAMTGHTALNLIWLALFLRDRPWCHVLAMAISVLACGLHQLVFHPLFAGPLLLWRLRQGRYALFAAYTVVFASALTFWMLYPGIAIRSAGVVAAGGAAEPAYFWRDRVLPLILERDKGTVLATLLNLMRYVSWQHLALVPLAAATWPLVRRGEGIALPLFAGIVLTIVFCIIILPFQGHGWGYRYMCGVLGNAVLLGGIGYQRWASRARPVADGLFISLSVMTLIASVFLMARTHQFIAPYVRVDRLIGSAPSEMVLVDTEEPRAAIDQVRNRPDLTNRPLRLSSKEVTASGLAELCRRGTISLVTRADMQAIGFADSVPTRSPVFERKVAKALQGQPCLVPHSRSRL